MSCDDLEERQDSGERRFWKRLSSNEMVVTVRRGTRCFPALVIDKSFGGIGMQLESAVALEVEETITIDCNGEFMEAKIKRIDNLEDGTIRVACEWLVQADAFGKIYTHLVGRAAD